MTTILGEDLPFRMTAYDGTEIGPPNSPTTVHIRTRDAIARIAAARGQEIGFSRAIIAGDIEIEGDIFAIFDVTDRLSTPTLDREMLRSASQALGLNGWRDVAKLRPLPPPPEEIRLAGRLHSRKRDAAAISTHYDVSNTFYDLVLGPSMSYSCAVFETEAPGSKWAAPFQRVNKLGGGSTSGLVSAY